MLVKLTPGVIPIKLFWYKFRSVFCKLDHFINVNTICLGVGKRCSLQKRVNKFIANTLNEIDPSKEIYSVFKVTSFLKIFSTMKWSSLQKEWLNLLQNASVELGLEKIKDNNYFLFSMSSIVTIVLTGLHVKGKLPALTAHIRLSWKWMTLANTSAYYGMAFNSTIKVL